MGTYAGTGTFHSAVYQFEETDPVQGGTDGIDNLPIKQLADRTAFLKNSNDSMIGLVAFFAQGTAPTGWLKANGARLTRTTYQSLFDKIGTRYGQRVTSPGGGSAVFTSTDRLGSSTAHGFSNGDLLNVWDLVGGGTFTALFGGVGSPITSATACYVRVLSANTFSLHPTATDATNNTNAAEAVTFAAGAYVVVEYSDKFTVPDLREEFISGWVDNGTTGRLLGTSEAFGGAGTAYANIALLACIKYE